MYFQTGGLYPEKRFLYGMSKNISILDYLVNSYNPVYSTKSWQIPKYKVKTRDPAFWKNHKYGPQLTADKDDWEKYDKVIDFYTESSRVSNPGYGEKYSSMEIWNGISNNDTITSIKADNPEELREKIYNAVKDARPAYVTASKGLYKRLKELNTKATNVLDISAFGDRMVAAAGCQLHYTGLDPDDSLCVGISKLQQDLEKVTTYNNKVYTLPLEGFWPRDKYGIITISPPPFNAEPYTHGEHQTHKTYPDFMSWFNGFLREMMYRCSKWILPNGIFAFSVLDRIPRENENGVTLIYTEAMIFLAEQHGFEFVEIFGLATGTPWWVFKYTGVSSDKLVKFYPELSVNLPKTFLLEFIRKCCLKYVSKFFDNYKKIDKFLGQFLMSKMDSNGDPVFIDKSSSYAFENFDSLEVTNNKFVFQNADGSYYALAEFKDKKSYIIDIFDILSRYIRWISSTSAFLSASGKVKIILDKDKFINLVVEKRYATSVIGMLRKMVPFGEVFKIKDFGGPILSIWKSSMTYVNTSVSMENRALSDLRYDVLDIHGHHFTRPKERINIMEKASGEKIVDLFATPFNANSDLFTSPYPDVDVQSLGNFFTLDFSKMKHKTFMANPPDYPGFIDKVIEKINDVLESDEVTFYVGTVLWEDTEGYYIKAIRNAENIDFGDVNNPILSYVFNKIEPSFLKMMYVLNKNKFPSVNPVNGKKSLRDGTESVGILLSSKKNWTFSKELEKLGDIIIFE